MRFSSIFKIIILNIFISKMAHAAVCEERYPADSEECQYVQELEQKAEQGDESAQFSLGSWYAEGRYVKPDYKLAIKWLEKAGKQGSDFSYFILGYHYNYGENFPLSRQKALEWYRKAAELGDSSTQEILGDAYMYGDGFPQNTQLALEWYRKAASPTNDAGVVRGQGSASSAQFKLGVMYAHGQGVPQDYQQTAILMRKAAENMYYPAQLYLGVAYFYGEGVPQDYRQAVYWLNEGIPGSYTPGHIPLNALYDKAHPADRVHSQTWYRKTAQRVMAKVQYNFGVWYLQRLSLIERSQPGAGVVSQSRSARIGRGAGCDRRDVYAG
ncbi:tetratricopeptide repeat protein [Salmonella enterica subsp. enterica]|nr:tetratricopeptide repeat protein [Salmonella enterica subsp. enterica]